MVVPSKWIWDLSQKWRCRQNRFHGNLTRMSTVRQLVSLRRLAAAVAVLCSLIAVRAARAGAQVPATRAPWGLFSARFDTRTSDFVYAVYGYGRSFAMVGTLQNPRSGWTELVGAVGRTFAIGGGPTHSIATGVARASDGWYGQLYYVPTVGAGPLRVRATAEWDVPLSKRGATQFALSPLSVTVPVVRFVETGMSMDLGAEKGSRTTVAIGPELRVAIPGAAIGSDIQRLTDGSASRVRLFFTTQF
jgi:hypothetical protein